MNPLEKENLVPCSEEYRATAPIEQTSREVGDLPSMLGDKPKYKGDKQVAPSILDDITAKDLVDNMPEEGDKPSYVVLPRYNAGLYKPHKLVKYEKPEHRKICILKARGLQNVQISEQTGYSYHMVCETLKQPWAAEVIDTLQREYGVEQVKDVFRENACAAAQLLVDQFKDTNIKAEVRQNAAKSVLDRFLGKPTEKIEVSDKPTAELTDEELIKLAQSGSQN